MLKFNKSICVIVDAYSTGRYLAAVFLSYGYQCLHIQSSKYLPSDLSKSLRNNDFIQTIVYDGDIAKLISLLNQFSVKLCVPGYESGVELADLISEKLGLPSNGSSLSQARRNKRLMCERVSTFGMKVAKQICSDNLDSILQWMNVENISYPIVLKPLSSANGDNVHFCMSQPDILNAFNKIIQKSNCFGDKNTEALAQQYLDGEEYIVNTVSCESQHVISEIWQVHRKPYTTIYDFCEILPYDEKRYEALTEFTKQILDVMGIKYGAATTELKYTSQGIALIEMASRLMGSAELSVTTEINSHNQLKLMAEAYINPHIFLVFSRNLIKLNKHKLKCMAVLLISNVVGDIEYEPNIDLFKNLKTFYSIEMLSKGDKLTLTTDSLNSPGVVYLCSEHEHELKHDYYAIRDIETYFYKQMLWLAVFLHS